jgi:hypothetical protein
LSQNYNIPSVYFYGVDEATGNALLAQRPAWQTIRSLGGKMFVAGYVGSQGNFALMGDIQDLMICAGAPSSTEAAKWHSVGHKIFNYGNPQVGEEKPETYRRNFGLLLWQKDFDGAMDYAYQHSFGSIWNDYDHDHYRDHNFTYPTLNGIIDTIQWEGFREGVNDTRYLTTLLDKIKTAKLAGISTVAAETWLANLKISDLKTVNLDSVRAEMINNILSLQSQISSCNSCGLGTPIITPSSPISGTSFTITCPTNASGYDCINAYANGSQNKCTFSAYSGNNAIFNCTGLTTGSYTSKCEAITGTSRNCCAANMTGSYAVQAAPVTPTPTTTPITTPTPIPIPTTTPTSTPISISTNIAQLQALIQQLLAQVAQLQAQLALQQQTSQFRFLNPLYFGLSNNDVRQLQLFLVSQGTAIYPEAKVTGYFGLLTRKAVIRFQLKYNIITSEYSPGAGLVGIKTRAKINEILGR